MFNKKENIKDEIILMTLSELVPTNHFLRKVAEAIDFKFRLLTNRSTACFLTEIKSLKWYNISIQRRF